MKSLITLIPEEFRDGFLREIYKETLFRSILAVIVIIGSQIGILLFFKGYLFSTELTAYCVILFNVLFFPVLFCIYRKIDVAGYWTLRICTFSYIFGALALFCALAVISQDRYASINTYIMALFGISACMYIRPLDSFIMYSAVYAGFFFMLPVCQTAVDVVAILRVNAFIMSVFAWLLGRIVFRMRVRTYTDKLIIQENNQILREMVTRDPMTSLFNHDYALKKLGEEIEKTKRIGYPLSVIMMDIDNFKPINDLFGHQAGDEAIVNVAGMLADTCRITDIVCRYGGEEFLLILPGTGLADAARLAERIRIRIEGTECLCGVCVTVSGGISEFQDESASELVYKADQHLYKAKCEGKNRFSLASRCDGPCPRKD